MQITLDTGGRTPLMTLAGRLDSAGAADFEDARRRLPPTAATVILDLSAVDFLSSVGIRCILLLEKELRTRAGGLILAGVPPLVRRILETAGLFDRLRSAPDRAAALALADRPASQGQGLAAGHPTRWLQLTDSPATLRRWPTPDGRDGGLTPAEPGELGLTFGQAGIGACHRDATHPGPFVSIGGRLASLPGDGRGLADLLTPETAACCGVFLAAGVTFDGPPTWWVEGPDATVSWGDWLAALPGLLAAGGQPPDVRYGFVLTAKAQDTPRPDQGEPEELPAHRHLLLVGLLEPGGPAGPSLTGHALGIDTPPPVIGSTGDPHRLAEAWIDMENFRDLLTLDPGDPILHPQGWVYRLTEERPARADRLQLDTAAAGDPFPVEWELLVRRVYAGADRVVLTRLGGGYSAAAFHADTFDRSGRRLIPTVFKISGHAFTDREEAAYGQHVRPFILNNTAVIMGRAILGEWSAIRYSFVGLDGSDTRLTWLADHYVNRPPADLEPILDRLFTRILAPWYGQSRTTRTHPFRTHDPSGLFPRLTEDAWDTLGVATDTPRIDCPWLGQTLPNPYHVLGHVFPRHREWTRDTRVAVTHGDLNLNNILLDDKENLYVIDFSETRERHVGSDFARLEPLLLLQLTRLAGEADARRLLAVAADWLTTPRLETPLPPLPNTDDPMLVKAHAVTGLLRRHAARLAGTDDAWIDYLFPLLEWTLPLVSFRQLEPDRKRLSMYVAGLICRRLEQLGCLGKLQA